jgi:hypothetical protein
MPGYEIVHVTFANPLPYRQGFDRLAAYLTAIDRPRLALCAIELRSPKPFTFAGFQEFNQGYQALLADWDLLVGDQNPIARTNIAPSLRPPVEPTLYAFSYTRPLTTETEAGSTFIVAGAGELRGEGLGPAEVVQPNDTSSAGMAAKAAQVMRHMQARLTGLQVDWSAVTTVDIYTEQPLHAFLSTEILNPMQAAVEHGIHWFYSRPPIIDLEFEMDMRGVRCELRL